MSQRRLFLHCSEHSSVNSFEKGEIFVSLIETLQMFGMGVAVIIYLLVERAARVGILRSAKLKFLAPGAIALLFVVSVWPSLSPRPPVYMALLAWLGLWVAAMMVKSTVSDQKPPDKPAV
jgi:hypothetical protein